MALNDRDYMRERHHRSAFGADRPAPFTPPKESPSLLGMIGFWICLAFVLYKGYGWWHEKQTSERLAGPPVRPIQEAPPQARHQPSPPPAQVVNPEPPPPSAQEVPEATTGGTIYLCKAYDGRTFWAQAHCAQHRALIDSMAYVPAGLPFEEQVRIARQERQELAQPLHAPASPSVASTAQADTRQTECKLLDARVEQLDAMARQPQSASMQDWIRGERKKARDRQFALRC